MKSINSSFLQTIYLYGLEETIRAVLVIFFIKVSKFTFE